MPINSAKEFSSIVANSFRLMFRTENQNMVVVFIELVLGEQLTFIASIVPEDLAHPILNSVMLSTRGHKLFEL